MFPQPQQRQRRRSETVSVFSSIAKALFDHYYYLDEPRPNELLIPYGKMQKPGSPNEAWQARLTYVVYVNDTRKVHNVDVQFLTDSNNKIKKETLCLV